MFAFGFFPSYSTLNSVSLQGFPLQGVFIVTVAVICLEDGETTFYLQFQTLFHANVLTVGLTHEVAQRLARTHFDFRNVISDGQKPALAKVDLYSLYKQGQMGSGGMCLGWCVPPPPPPPTIDEEIGPSFRPAWHLLLQLAVLRKKTLLQIFRLAQLHPMMQPRL